MPTFFAVVRFQREYRKLSEPDRHRFERVVREQFVPDLQAGSFRPGLRVRGVEGAPGVFEMTWAPDGRATWEYGAEVRTGEVHVIWRRIGRHQIFGDP